MFLSIYQLELPLSARPCGQWPGCGLCGSDKRLQNLVLTVCLQRNSLDGEFGVWKTIIIYMIAPLYFYYYTMHKCRFTEKKGKLQMVGINEERKGERRFWDRIKGCIAFWKIENRKRHSREQKFEQILWGDVMGWVVFTTAHKFLFGSPNILYLGVWLHLAIGPFKRWWI